jgi:TolB-like protein/predicted Ser/Thr protein kinase
MIGKTISHYKILEKLGEGGMGVVYKAEDTKLDRTVALKFLTRQVIGSDEEEARFVHEAKAAAALSHPNICTVHEIDDSKGQTFIAMECVEGQSLKRRIESGPLKLDDAVDVAIQIAEGLQEAHEKGIVHRDIKPANVMVTSKGQAKIMDFGLAKSAGGTLVTQDGTTLGTVAYMSPEQARGRSADQRSDIWSLGAVLYEMVGGRRPFEGDYGPAVVYSILNQAQEPLTALRTGVPMELERIVNKALSKDLEERYQHVDEFVVDLKSVAKALKSGEAGADVVPGMGRGRGRYHAYAAVLAFVGVMLVGAAILYQLGVFDRSAASIDSIAVLPLENLSGDPEQEYFADGMTDALIADLAKIRALRVISRTSAMHYKGTDKPLPEIASELNVDAIVEGTVVRSGDRVRITAQLIHAKEDRHLWAESYEREIRDVLDLQGELAQAIAGEIRVELSPQERAILTDARPVDPEAYQLYLKGRYHWNKRTEQGVRKAIDYFEMAVDVDPGCAPAYCGLSDSYSILAAFGHVPWAESLRKSTVAAFKALELDDKLAEAHVSVATVFHNHMWDWAKAEAEYRRAIELNPGYATGHHWHALQLATMGRFDEAVVEARKAQDLDPLSVMVNVDVGWIYYCAHRYDRAIEEYLKMADMYPDFQTVHAYLAVVYAKKEMYEESIAELRKAPAPSDGEPLALAYFCCAYGLVGRHDEAREIVDELTDRIELRGVAPYFLAIAYAGLGESDQVMRWLKKACEERAIVNEVLRDPVFDFVREDQRFVTLMNTMGLPT